MSGVICIKLYKRATWVLLLISYGQTSLPWLFLTHIWTKPPKKESMNNLMGDQQHAVKRQNKTGQASSINISWDIFINAESAVHFMLSLRNDHSVSVCSQDSALVERHTAGFIPLAQTFYWKEDLCRLSAFEMLKPQIFPAKVPSSLCSSHFWI